MYGWRPEDSFRCRPQEGLHTPPHQGLSLAWSSAIRLGWLAVGRDPPVLSWHWDYQCAPLYPALLHGSGHQTQILIHARWALQGQVMVLCACLPKGIKKLFVQSA